MPTPPKPKEPARRGRPEVPDKLKRERVNARLPRWLLVWLDSQSVPAAELIESALLKAHRLKPPKL